MAIGYFVLPHLSIDLGVYGSYLRNESKGSSEVGQLALVPGLGYDIPISSRFSFYPRAWLGFGALASTGVTALRVYVSAFLPILFHVAPHFFVGFGPSITRDLVDKDPTRTSDNNPGTNVGGLLTVGGFL